MPVSASAQRIQDIAMAAGITTLVVLFVRYVWPNQGWFFSILIGLLATFPLWEGLDSIFGKPGGRAGTLDGVVHLSGVVCKQLNPSGTVRINGEYWSAKSTSGETLAEGTLVQVISRSGLTVLVEKQNASDRTA